MIATSAPAPYTARNVHFATVDFMADSQLLWQALQWVVYGIDTPIGLKMGRNNSLFVSRNDMDQSKRHYDPTKPSANDADTFGNSVNTDFPLYNNYLLPWKANYNFLGSYYINIGNDVPNLEYTTWVSNPSTASSPSAYDAKPLYQKYEAMGNEIGTHSYTHIMNTYPTVYPSPPYPANTSTNNDTNYLTPDPSPLPTSPAPTSFQFEFKNSMDQIAANLNPTWLSQNIRGAAVPGMPDSLQTAHNIMAYTDYLSGGASLIGAGYPSAIGYLTPTDTKVYLSPNMSFDFTMVGFGVPVVTPPSTVAVATPLAPNDADLWWAAEYNRLAKHASQPIVHWAWHDYGPTSASNTTYALQGFGSLYNPTMFQNNVARAYAGGAEFMTGADAVQRINTFKNTKMTVTKNSTSNFTAAVASSGVGKFALGLNLPTGTVIQNVTNWYAYNNNMVFLPNAGGTFTIQTGATASAVTHITQMPMRSTLSTLTGNGTTLSLSFIGEGAVQLALSQAASTFKYALDGITYPLTTLPAGKTCDNAVVTKNTVFLSGSTVCTRFTAYGTHTVAVGL